MKKLNVKKNWNCKKTHTTQNVELSKKIVEKFNYYLKKLIKQKNKKNNNKCSEMNLLTYDTPIWNYERAKILQSYEE